MPTTKPVTDNDTRQRGLDGPFHPYESDHTGLVHVLWAAQREGLSLDRSEDCDAIASLILRSRWHAATKAEAKQAAWAEGRESLAADFTRPLSETGMRETSPNPYAYAEVPRPIVDPAVEGRGL
jgi:hypothetical protein